MNRHLAVAGLWLVAATALADPYYGPYRASVVYVQDGDTLEADVAIWPGLSARVKVRLRGIDTPELHAPEPCEVALAQRARDFTVSWVDQRQGQVTLTEVGLGKYAGRMLGGVSVGEEDLRDALLAAGLARPYVSGRHGGWCEGRK